MALTEWQRDFVRRWYPEAQQEEALRLVEETGYNEESFLRDRMIIDTLVAMRPSEEEFRAELHGIIGAYHVSLSQRPLPMNETISVAGDFNVNTSMIKPLKDRVKPAETIRRKPHPSLSFHIPHKEAKVWQHARGLAELPWWRESFISIKRCPAVLMGEDKNRQCQLWEKHETRSVAHAYEMGDRSIMRWVEKR